MNKKIESFNENDDADQILEYSERILQQYLGKDFNQFNEEKRAHITLKNHPQPMMEIIDEYHEHYQ